MAGIRAGAPDEARNLQAEYPDPLQACGSCVPCT